MFNDPNTEAKLCQMVATVKKLIRFGRSFEVAVRYYPKEKKLVYRVTQDDLQEAHAICVHCPHVDAIER